LNGSNGDDDVRYARRSKGPEDQVYNESYGIVQPSMWRDGSMATLTSAWVSGEISHILLNILTLCPITHISVKVALETTN